MNIETLKQELRRDEAERLKPYRCSAGKLTIGVGRNLDDRGIRKSESDFMLDNDIEEVQDELDKALPWWRNMTDARQRALSNMCFNLGLPRLLNFKNMLSQMEEGCYKDAARSALNSRWAEQVGDRAKRIAKLIENG